MRTHLLLKGIIVGILAILFCGILLGCTSSTTANPTPSSQVGVTSDKQEPTNTPFVTSDQQKSTNTPAVTPSPLDPKFVDPWSEEAAEVEVIDWGSKISMEEVIVLAKSEDLFEIQWHVMPNVVRVLMQDGSIYHFENANIGIDIEKTLNDAGVKTRKGGISLRYSFCN